MHEAFWIIEDDEDTSKLRQTFLNLIVGNCKEIVLIMNLNLDIIIKKDPLLFFTPLDTVDLVVQYNNGIDLMNFGEYFNNIYIFKLGYFCITFWKSVL